MILDLKKYGFEDLEEYKLNTDKITSVGGPFPFNEVLTMPSGFTGTFAAAFNETIGFGELNNIDWNPKYIPPHETKMLGQIKIVLPHHFINVKCDSEHYQFAKVNIGYKLKRLGKNDMGKIDPILQEFYNDLEKMINEKNPIKEDYSSFSGNRDLSNDTYQLYLVEKYNIKKNDTLNKFVLNSKPYNNLEDVLKVAHDLENN